MVFRILGPWSAGVETPGQVDRETGRKAVG